MACTHCHLAIPLCRVHSDVFPIIMTAEFVSKLLGLNSECQGILIGMYPEQYRLSPFHLSKLIWLGYFSFIGTDAANVP